MCLVHELWYTSFQAVITKIPLSVIIYILEPEIIESLCK